MRVVPIIELNHVSFHQGILGAIEHDIVLVVFNLNLRYLLNHITPVNL